MLMRFFGGFIAFWSVWDFSENSRAFLGVPGAKNQASFQANLLIKKPLKITIEKLTSHRFFLPSLNTKFSE
jgi:hypothetical protein